MRRVLFLSAVLASVVSAGCSAERITASSMRVQPYPQRSAIAGGSVLYVLDGKILQRNAADTSSLPKELLELNDDEIDQIEVLKGQTAKRRFGTAGENGVVLITTKHRS